MRFWDSSALVPLFVEEGRSRELTTWVEDDADLVAWELSDIELRSAFARLAREGKITSRGFQELSQSMDAFFRRLNLVELSESVKLRARRLVGVHPLRAADALQLAAALASCSDDPSSYELVTLDERLGDAARREGFLVRP